MLLYYWTTFWIAFVINKLLLAILVACSFGVWPCKRINRANSGNINDPTAPPPTVEDHHDDPAADETTPSTIFSHRHKRLLARYLAVYLPGVLADWLQGPYVYALYAMYGLAQHDIAVLFVAGFGASMIMGTFVGQFADVGGRRRFVVGYAVIYAASCLTKHVNNYWILLLGRLLGGIATSLLFSVFESWLIRAHADQGLLGNGNPNDYHPENDNTIHNNDPDHDATNNNFLSQSLSIATYANSVVAIIAGLVANHVADTTQLTPLFHHQDNAIYRGGGYLAPFDVALGALAVCGCLAAVLWEENYGSNDIRNNGDENNDNTTNPSDNDPAMRMMMTTQTTTTTTTTTPHVSDTTTLPQHRKHIMNLLNGAWTALLDDPKIVLCGIVSSIFEGLMYVFVFMWTPLLVALEQGNNNTDGGGYSNIPFGLVFATFMISIMMGSSLNMMLIQFWHCQAQHVMIGVLALATVCLGILGWHHGNATSSWLWVYAAMNGFEFCVGMYYPLIGMLKGSLVPERHRAAIYNLFRIPLNAIVLVTLLNDFSPATSFQCAAIFMLGAVLLQLLLARQMTGLVMGQEGQQRTTTNHPYHGSYHVVLDDDGEDEAEEQRLELS